MPSATVAKNKRFSSNLMSSSPKVLDLDVFFSSDEALIFMVTLLCARVLSEQALWPLLKPFDQAGKRSTNPNLWARVSSGGVGVFHVKGWAKKIGMSLETQKTKLFGGRSRDVGRDIPGVPEKLEKKRLVFDFSPQHF